ncbi:MAG TPA: CoA-binding protein [Candidatus Ozemobacteraceae bacterium]|nr:CoA-binding protein [Candidatus Ozemobacteraceae bacterium]HQG27497.1 CoA-binding protein [Candidatus Ozemobacteraceae bacterium]
MNVAVVGASNKPDRYSYKAVMMLKEKGHVPFPVHPSLKTVGEFAVFPGIRSIQEPIDTITIYLSAANQKNIEEEILQSSARRVIFNPGAENPTLTERLRTAGKEAIDACTLVLLSTGRF